MNRLHNLDYLRGLAAFGIMLYHYTYWSFGDYDASSIMGRIGTYGVSIFYILSGLTLYYVYINKMVPNQSDVVQFFKKRALRILPLLWLATFLTIAIDRKIPNLYDLGLNLTGLFSILQWDKYFATGVWSIGNELTFYLFFPFFIYFAKKSKVLLYSFGALLFAIFVYFAFFVLDNNQSLSEQFKIYINPLNQVFIFFGGFIMGYIFEKKVYNTSVNIAILTVGILLFTFYPVVGNEINLVSGVNRLLFLLFSFLICFGFYKMDINVPKFIHNPLSLLGEISYSLYLLHPIVYAVLCFVNKMLGLNKVAIILISIPSTIITSYFVYQKFEKYFMKLGKPQKTQ